MAQNAALNDARCSICIDVEQRLATFVDKDEFATELFHIGDRLYFREAMRVDFGFLATVVTDGVAYRIDSGADLAALSEWRRA